MIKEQEQALFAQWRAERGYPTFMKDGLFDEEAWSRQAVKILYVLKEADWPGGDCDLCEYLLSETSPTYWKTWNNIVRWTQAIRVGGTYPRTVTKADKTACLRTIAALNIKKTGGGAEANDRTLSCAAAAATAKTRTFCTVMCSPNRCRNGSRPYESTITSSAPCARARSSPFSPSDIRRSGADTPSLRKASTISRRSPKNCAAEGI